MTDIRWYQTLALWKSIVFMEGNYKRASGRRHRRPVPQGLRRRRHPAGRARGGGDASVPRAAGLLDRLGRRADDRPVRVVRGVLRAPRASSPRRCATCSATTRRRAACWSTSSAGASTSAEFEQRFAPMLGRCRDDGPGRPPVRRQRRRTSGCSAPCRPRATRACRTGLISNSWGVDALPAGADGRPVRRRRHLRHRRASASPAPEIYAMGAERGRPAAGGVRLRRRPGLQPQAGEGARAWRRSCTRTPRRRSRSSRSCSA